MRLMRLDLEDASSLSIKAIAQRNSARSIASLLKQVWEGDRPSF